MDGRTHWEGCWRDHLDCAVARVEALEAERDRLRDVVGEVHAWIVCSCIASSDDMMQNAERIEFICRAALKGEG